jgi:uncharacterized membrane protein
VKLLLNVLVGILLIGYPFAVFFGLKYFDPRAIALLLVGLLLFRFILMPKGPKNVSRWTLGVALLIGILIFCAVLLLRDPIFIRLYPVAMSTLFFISFAYTLKHRPSMIERFARLRYKKLPAKAGPYCKKVTLVWCGFFLLNGLFALYTALFGTLELWTFYNGFLSYIFMGGLFLGEFIFRQWKVQWK